MCAQPLPTLRPSPIAVTEIEDRFWKPRLRANRTATLPTEYRLCKSTGRIDAWSWKEGRPNRPHRFWDSDVAKWIEAAAYSLMTHPDPGLEKKVDAVVDLMARHQQRDGYLNSYFQKIEPGKQWTNLRVMHELYCAGHLIEAAVAYFQATGKRKFLDVMRRYADHIDSVFGREKGKKRGYCGHEEIELALVKLYRATGERRYLKLAKYFVDERGRKPHYWDVEARAAGVDIPPGGFDYTLFQCHRPVREQKEAVGHSVRAMYLYCGMADVAAETGDKSLLQACRRLWRSVTRRRMYITGGIGSAASGERFTHDYDLPNETAYAETCANIGLAFFAHRMLQIERDGEYADVMERALYNGVLSGISQDGRRFFYANHLTVYPPVLKGAANYLAGVRQKWFSCACCPPNVARLLASFGQYVYSSSDTEAYVHLFLQSWTEMEVGGKKVQLIQVTEYPWDERVRIIFQAPAPVEFTLAVRIPGWCRGVRMKVNSKPVDAASLTRKGYARIHRLWRTGDDVELTLPMPVQEIEANPRVRMDCGKVALQRGPLVYCLEEADNGPNLADLVLPRRAQFKLRYEKNLLGGVVTISGKASRRGVKPGDEFLYRPISSRSRTVNFKAVPYCLWANRRPGEMLVWLRKET